MKIRTTDAKAEGFHVSISAKPMWWLDRQIHVDPVEFGEGEPEIEGAEEIRAFDPEALEGYLNRIPAVEADAIELVVLKGCRQTDVAIVLGPEGEPPYVQASISYMIKQGMKRLQYLHQLDSLELSPKLVRAAALEAGVSKDRADLLADVWVTQSYWETGQRLGIRGDPQLSASRVRSRCVTVRDLMFRLRAEGIGSPVFLRVCRWFEIYQPCTMHQQERRPAAWRAAHAVPMVRGVGRGGGTHGIVKRKRWV